MKKVFFLIFLILLISGGAYVYTNYVKTGALRELAVGVFPPDKTIKEFFSKGSNLEKPLKIAAPLRIGVFADLETGKPRVLAIDPNGVLFTSITNEGRIVAMPDKNKDGVADDTVNVLSGLSQPHGILFNDQYLYIAETNKVSRYFYEPNSMTAGVRHELINLPSGGGHFTRTIKVFDNKLYTSIGSSCNVCTESDQRRAAIYVSDLDGSNFKLFASGLRNTVFFTVDKSGRIWGNDMGRDLLGDNLPPEDLNIIEEGGDYGWPFCYGSRVADKAFMGQNEPNRCEKTKPPAFEYPAHVAPLGIAFIDSDLFPADDQGDILAAFHGSWNSSVPVGYKIVKLKVNGDKVISSSDFLTGFLPLAGNENDVLGRPVDLLFDKEGYLYISDDKSGLIYVVSKN